MVAFGSHFESTVGELMHKLDDQEKVTGKQDEKEREQVRAAPSRAASSLISEDCHHILERVWLIDFCHVTTATT